MEEYSNDRDLFESPQEQGYASAPAEEIYTEPQEEIPAAPEEVDTEPQEETPAAPGEVNTEPQEETPAAPEEVDTEPQEETPAAPEDAYKEPQEYEAHAKKDTPVDFYADGTPVIEHGVRPGNTQTKDPAQDGPQYGDPQNAGPRMDRGGMAGQNNTDDRPYRQYQFGSEWRERQVSPQPMGGKDPGKKNKNGLIAAIAIVAVIGILAGALFAGIRAASGWVESGEEFAEPDTQLAEPVPAEPKAETPEAKEAAPTLIPAAPSQSEEAESDTSASAAAQAQPSLSVADVAEMSMPAMVSITTMTVQQVYSFYGGLENREAQSAGSGIIVGQTDSEILIATNDHVVSGAKSLSVCFVDEEVVEAAVKGTDTQNDLAIVAVALSDVPAETMEKIRVISIGDSDELRIGEQVVAIGNALGFGQSVSAGVVSAKNRTVTLDDGDHVLLQTDAAINPGNSGGALLNMKGELIGINEIKYVAEDTEGIGYAIPITFAKPVLNELMERQTRTKVAEDNRGYLGITCITVQAEYSDMYRIPAGVYVDNVVDGGAAASAGIKARDIIVKLGDVEISTQEQLVDELAYYAAGETVTVTVSRLGADNEYKEMEFDVKLAVRPKDLDQSAPAQEEDGAEESQDMPEGFDGFFRIPGR